MKKSAIIADSQIVAQMQAQPREAIALILQKYGGALLWAIKKVVPYEEVAEDLLQDACVKIWKNAAQYDPAKGELFTWMVRICRNVAIDRVRTKKFQSRQTSKNLDESVVNSIQFSEELVIGDSGLRQQIGKLDEKYQEIIDLLYFQGYTQRQITEEMGIPLGTVKSRAKIALRELRNLLGDQLHLLSLLALLGSAILQILFSWF